MTVLLAMIRSSTVRPPGGRNVEDLIMTNSAVMVSVLTTALYVRELATRPADVTAIVTSLN